MAGVDSRLLLPFSGWWGDADLLRCLTEGRAAESSLGVGLGARLDGMLIPLISDMKSSPTTSPPKPNYCTLSKYLNVCNFGQLVALTLMKPNFLQIILQKEASRHVKHFEGYITKQWFLFDRLWLFNFQIMQLHLFLLLPSNIVLLFTMGKQ
jgi:hypothetical protein